MPLGLVWRTRLVSPVAVATYSEWSLDMNSSFNTPSRTEILAVACPKCGAERYEACRRGDGKSDAPRIQLARGVLTRLRKKLQDSAKPAAVAKRVNRDFLRP